LAQHGVEVLVIESAEGIGTGTSSRNSEVIHAGIYYPAGSLMARLCVEGRAALYAYCRERRVPHKRCGKLIVATTEAEASQLANIAVRAAANGVDDIQRLSAAEARGLEPNLACAAALLSPSTGILDSHSYMVSLQGEAEEAGAIFAFHSPFLSAALDPQGFVVDVGGREATRIRSRILINAAGLHAPALARQIDALASEFVPKAYFAKGSYFQLTGRSPFSRLVYPAPVPGGLGVHLTLDLQGAARFGPDVEWVDKINYDVEPGRAASFYAAIRRYWPALPDGALEPAYSGVRPKIVGPGSPPQDFLVQGPGSHGVNGLINLFGVESPGLTASLALGDMVKDIVCARA
jgi:L-2-hydroxyglutarate oxidase LhgO